MSDAKDAVRKALALNRQLAGKKLARKQDLESSLAALRRERAAIEGEAPELDAAVSAAEEELAATDAELEAALAEIDELGRLGGGIDAGVARAQAAAILDPDPIIQSPEQAALERARDHIGDLDAQVRLHSELSDAAPARTPVSAADADAQAKAAFEELRARRAGGGAAGGPDAPRPPSKKTL